MQEWEEIAYAREEGRSKVIVRSVESLMKNLHVDLQRACDGVGTTLEEYHKAKEFISKYI